MTDQVLMDARVARRLRQAFWSRLRSDCTLVLVGNAVAVAAVVAAFWGHAAAPLLVSWAATAAAVVGARAAWQRRACRADTTDRRLLRISRAMVLLHALAWGIGAALLMRAAPAQYDAIMLAVLAGIVGAGLHTLTADSKSYYLLLGGIVAPLPIGLFAGEPEWEMAALVAIFSVVMVLVHRRMRAALIEHLRTVVQLTTAEETQSRLVAELRAALANVKTLSGLLPICSRCKKVRDDMGYWGSVERYIAEHTDARFTHGVCPDCYPKLFPDIPMPEAEEQPAGR